MNRHQIGTIAFELHGRNREDGFDLQQQVSQLFWDAVLPALEPVLDELAADDILVTFDRLVIDLGRIPAGSLKTRLAEQLALRLRELIQQRFSAPIPEERPEVRTLAAQDFRHWLGFLQYGQLPPHGGRRSEADMQRAVLEMLEKEPAALDQLLTLLRVQPAALLRLLRQHPAAFLHRITAIAASPGASDTLNQVQTEMLGLLERLSRLGEALKKAPYHQPVMAVRTWRAIIHQLEIAFQQQLRIFYWSILLQSRKAPEPEALLEAILVENIPATQQPFLFALLTDVFLQWETMPDYPTLQVPLQNILRRYGHSGGVTPATPKQSIPDLGTDGKPASADTALPKGPTQAPAPDARPAGTEAGADHTAKPAPVSGEQKPPLAGPRPTVLPETHEGADSPARPPVSGQHDEPKATKPIGRSLTEDLSQAPALPGEISGAIPGSHLEPGEYQYVENAGLVILHPFLPVFLEQNALVKDARFTDERARQMAVFLLHYLATGASDAPEYELLLPKLLCDWPASEPLERRIRLPKKTKREGEELLHAVIGHWSKLGSTSPEGLREGFLRRPGKLSRPDANTWLLQVEQSAIDILLNALPWGIGVVKLPWMPQLLHVEWNYG